MTQLPSKTLRNWLFATSFFIVVLIIFGGYVRLTRSGLSMVEWDIIQGVVPPTGEETWAETFEKYKQSPEFQKINKNMTLERYKTIFYNEYIHRMLGRFTGMLFVVPLFTFLIKRDIPWRKSGIYLLIGLGFAGQGLLGWYMVMSGLVDRPEVSHYRLTAHLVTALSLLGFTLWAAFDNIYDDSGKKKPLNKTQAFLLAFGLLLVLTVQISYGGFVAGLKAGYMSNTWPLMFGSWIPDGLLSYIQPWWKNLLETPATVYYVHRWFAFVVLAVSAWLYYLAKNNGFPDEFRKGALVMLALVAVQITLGVTVVWFSIQIVLALVHQGTAIALFGATVFLLHRLARA